MLDFLTHCEPPSISPSPDLPQFQQTIRHKFQTESAWSPEFFEANTEFHADLEVDALGEPTTPIHDALGQKYTRFGQQANENQYAAFFKQADGSLYQMRLSRFRKDKSGKDIKYETRLGSKKTVWLPTIPTSDHDRINQQQGYDIPTGGDFWKYVKEHPEIGIIADEGVGRLGALIGAGYVTIVGQGCFGFVHTKDADGNPTTPYLVKELEPFAVPGRDFTIVFDADHKQATIAAVNAAKFQTALALQRRGCNVYIIDRTPELGKGSDDVIARHGADAFHALYANRVSFRQWTASTLDKMLYAPAIEMCEQKIPRGLELPDPLAQALIALFSPKASGKSTLLASTADRLLQAGYKIINISHRRQLCEELSGKLGITSVPEIQKTTGDRRQQLKRSAEEKGFGIVVDSMHPKSQAEFNASEYKGYVVFIDEVEQVLDHLLNSETCKENRVEILRQVTALLRNAAQIIFADADLSNVAIDWVKGIAGDRFQNPWILKNTGLPEASNVYSYSTPEAYLKALLSKLEQGEKVFISLDSQQPKGKYSAQSLEKLFKRLFPDKPSLRIDSSTISQKGHPAYGCIQHINEVFSCYDIVIATPCIETGVSYDVEGHFDSVWSFHYGAISANSICQSIARVREAVDRHCFVNDRGVGVSMRGVTSVKALRESIDEQAKKALHQLCDAAEQGYSTDTEFLEASKNAWAKIICRRNQGMLQLKVSVLERLAADGHNIIHADEIDRDEKIHISSVMAQNRNENLEERAEAIAAQPLITERQADSFRDTAITLEEQLQLERFDLNARYALSEIPQSEGAAIDIKDICLKDGFSWYSGIKTHYDLTVGRKFVKGSDRNRLEEMASDGVLFAPDVVKGTRINKVRALELLGIPELLEAGREFMENDAALGALADKAIAASKDIKTLLGFTIRLGDCMELAERKIAQGQKPEKPDTPIAIFKKFLKLLGLSLVCVGQRGSRGQRVRVYKIATQAEAIAEYRKNAKGSSNRMDQQFFGLNDGREVIFEAWKARTESAIARKQSKEQEQVENVASNTISQSCAQNSLIDLTYKKNLCTDLADLSKHASIDTPEANTIAPDTEGAIATGCEVRYGSSIAEWFVEALAGETATIFSPVTAAAGYGGQLTVSVSKLKPVDSMSVAT
jgi:Domain of unknown function (DUF3854)